MKTIALLGGTGRTGLLVAEQALEQGYRLRILARTPERFPITHPGITLIKGDVTQRRDIQTTLEGADCVISVLGHTKHSSPNFQTQAMHYISEAMHYLGLHRILVLTGSGVIFKGEKESLGSKLVSWGIQAVAPNRFTDGQLQCEFLLSTSLQYTIVRAPMLTNGKLTARYNYGNLKIGMFSTISRADVAHFLMKSLQEALFIGEAPFIRY